MGTSRRTLPLIRDFAIFLACHTAALSTNIAAVQVVDVTERLTLFLAFYHRFRERSALGEGRCPHHNKFTKCCFLAFCYLLISF